MAECNAMLVLDLLSDVKRVKHFIGLHELGEAYARVLILIHLHCDAAGLNCYAATGCAELACLLA